MHLDSQHKGEGLKGKSSQPHTESHIHREPVTPRPVSLLEPYFIKIIYFDTLLVWRET